MAELLAGLGSGGGGQANLELEELGFALTLRDVFTNTVTVEVRPSMRICDVKKLVRAAKNESLDYLDGLVLLHDKQLLPDDATVAECGLSAETIVGISGQDAAKGRELRLQREAEAEARAAQAARRKKRLVGAGICAVCVVLLMFCLRLVADAMVCDQRREIVGGLFFCAAPAVPAQCREGMGRHLVVRGGATAYRTLDLDGARPEGRTHGGCQCTDDGDMRSDTDSCPSNFVALPSGWSLAPRDDASIGVIADHGWDTESITLADGSSWFTASAAAPGERCGRSSLDLVTCKRERVTTGRDAGDRCPAAPSNTYTVAHCPNRVLLRCP